MLRIVLIHNFMDIHKVVFSSEMLKEGLKELVHELGMWVMNIFGIKEVDSGIWGLGGLSAMRMRYRLRDGIDKVVAHVTISRLLV